MQTIFHLDEQGHIVALTETKYESEALLQRLVGTHPDILAGEQIDPGNPRKWILISREMGVPGREGGSDQWFLDHLLIDQDSVPTFVEVKRSTDTRIRREVVAQMLDYAANATAYWPAEHLRQAYEKQHEDPADALWEALGIPPEEADAYWAKVDSNLRTGKLRLLFVADEIPASLQRIIEFLNGQMTDTEVLGVEIKQYVSAASHRTLVPRLIGNTNAALQVKKAQKFEWTRETYLERVAGVSGEGASLVCEKLLQDFAQMGCWIYWGKGTKEAGFVATYSGKQKHQLAAVYCNGLRTKVELYFKHYKAPLHTEAAKKKLIAQLNTIPGIEIPETAMGRLPSFDIQLLTDENRYARFIAIYRQAMADVLAWEEANG